MTIINNSSNMLARLALLFLPVVLAGKIRLNSDFHQQLSVSPFGANFTTTATTSPLGGKLRYVKNSGVCGMSNSLMSASLLSSISTETTPNVFQASGYADLNANQACTP